MRPPTAEHAHLAGAYLALADDPEPAPVQRSVPRALCALAAGLVLAFAAPLAWASASVGEPRDLPAATASGKAAGVVADDDEDGGGGDGPGDATNGTEGAQTWAATIA